MTAPHGFAVDGKDPVHDVGGASEAAMMLAVSQLVVWDRMVEGARVHFMPGQGDDPATSENIDAHVYLGDGAHRYVTFMTTVEIGRVLQRWAQTGEAGGGRYFWCSDLVIVPRPGVEAMVAALGEMIRSGDVDKILSEVEDGSI